MVEYCGPYCKQADLKQKYKSNKNPKPVIKTRQMLNETQCIAAFQGTVEPVISGHPKINKTNVLKTNGSLMKVESIAECSLGAFCNTFDLHYAIICLEIVMSTKPSRPTWSMYLVIRSSSDTVSLALA